MNQPIDTLLKRFIDEPESLYTGWAELGQADRAKLLELEELFVRFKLHSDLAGKRHAEEDANQINETAEFIDKYFLPEAKNRELRLKEILQGDPSRILAIQRVVLALQSMKKKDFKRVPEALMNMVESELKKTKESTAPAPSIIVRIAEKTLEVVKSTFQGFQVLNLEGAAVRSQEAAVKGSARVQLEKTTDSGTIFTNIMIESPGYLTLVVRLQGFAGTARVQLKQDGRIIDSRNLDPATRSVDFRSISPGLYEIDLTGDMENRFSILVHEEES